MKTEATATSEADPYGMTNKKATATADSFAAPRNDNGEAADDECEDRVGGVHLAVGVG